LPATWWLFQNKTGTGFMLISRSDSTLRGHYPLETLTLKDQIEALSAAALTAKSSARSLRRAVVSRWTIFIMCAKAASSPQPGKPSLPRTRPLATAHRTWAIGVKRRPAGPSNHRR
jgi:hypothetical protein